MALTNGSIGNRFNPEKVVDDLVKAAQLHLKSKLMMVMTDHVDTEEITILQKIHTTRLTTRK